MRARTPPPRRDLMGSLVGSRGRTGPGPDDGVHRLAGVWSGWNSLRGRQSERRGCGPRSWCAGWRRRGPGAPHITLPALAVHPRTHNAYISAMRGQGAGAQPTLFRIDGAGKIDLVSMASLKYQSVELPTPPAANATGRQNPRSNVITDMGFADGRLWVAGLSNEEFASKLRAIPYPFANVDQGTSGEIYHGNHQKLE